MDVGSIASLATGMAQQETSDAVSIAVFKKALDMQGSAALMLINSITPTPNLPAHLGNHVNTKA